MRKAESACALPGKNAGEGWVDAISWLILCRLQIRTREVDIEILFYGALLRKFFFGEHSDAVGIIIDDFLERRVCRWSWRQLGNK
jgi:hypothetical protein